ncbi:LOW QUALITY PROTEIN: uncharacterized protein ACNS7B_002324 [Menidia menidia]
MCHVSFPPPHPPPHFFPKDPFAPSDGSTAAASSGVDLFGMMTVDTNSSLEACFSSVVPQPSPSPSPLFTSSSNTITTTATISASDATGPGTDLFSGKQRCVWSTFLPVLIVPTPLLPHRTLLVILSFSQPLFIAFLCHTFAMFSVFEPPQHFENFFQTLFFLGVHVFVDIFDSMPEPSLSRADPSPGADLFSAGTLSALTPAVLSPLVVSAFLLNPWL